MATGLLAAAINEGSTETKSLNATIMASAAAQHDMPVCCASERNVVLDVDEGPLDFRHHAQPLRQPPGSVTDLGRSARIRYVKVVVP